MRGFVLGFGLFGLDLVDFDAVFGVSEVRVGGEGVGTGDFSRGGLFAKDAVAGASEGLEGSLEFGVV